MKECSHCGAPVSSHFARTIEIRGQVFACTECSANASVFENAIARSKDV